jgi:hypothetical protein
MRQVTVRYKVKPDQAARNEELVRAVYDELRRVGPDGSQAGAIRREDGDAIRAFAGDNVDSAVSYPEDDRHLIEREPTVSHYDVAGSTPNPSASR